MFFDAKNNCFLPLMSQKVKIIGITGGSGSGKTTIATKLIQKIKGTASLVMLDSYYHDQSHLTVKERKNINFDHPDAIDFSLLIDHLQQLQNGHSVASPTYSFQTHCRLTETKIIHPSEIIILEGLLILNHKKLYGFFDRTIYISVPEKERLKRIIERDCAERGRTTNDIIKRFYDVILPMHHRYVAPGANITDQIIDNQDTDITLKRIHAMITEL